MPRGIHGHHVHADSLGETTRRRAFSDQPLRRGSRELLPTPLNFASSISPWTQDFDWEHERTIDQVWQGILSGKTDALEAGDHFRLASIIEVGIAGAWFPLTRKVVLMMQKSLLPGVTTVSGSLAREINRRVMACAER